METRKELLINEAASTANWRWQKADRFPTDSRNKDAAFALQELEVHLSSLPEDHPVFERYGYWSEDPIIGEQFQEYLNEYLMSYGFQREAEPEDLLQVFINFGN